MWKRSAWVKCQRRQNGKDSAVKIFGDVLFLNWIQIRKFADVYFFLTELRNNLFFKAGLRFFHQPTEFLANASQLGYWFSSIGTDFLTAGIHLGQQSGHPDHEKFIQIGI